MVSNPLYFFPLPTGDATTPCAKNSPPCTHRLIHRRSGSVYSDTICILLLTTTVICKYSGSIITNTPSPSRATPQHSSERLRTPAFSALSSACECLPSYPPKPPDRRYRALSMQCPGALDASGLGLPILPPSPLPCLPHSSSLPRTPSLGTFLWALKERLRTSREQPAPYDIPETGLSSCPGKRRISSALLGTPSPPCSKSVFCLQGKRGGKRKVMSSPSRTCLENAFLGPGVRDRGREERERDGEREKERVQRGHGTGGERKERVYKKNKNRYKNVFKTGARVAALSRQRIAN